MERFSPLGGTMGHASDGTNRYRAGRGRARTAIGALVAVALVATACGGGMKSPGAGSAARTTTATSPASGRSEEASQSQQLQFSQCMRSHGMPNFPDPSPSRGFLNAISASGINTKSPTFQAALRACKKYTPAGDMTPAQSAAESTEALQFSQCMRTHGVPNYPDPSTGPAGEQVIDLRGKGIDLGSPTFQAANEACQKIVPGSK